jgi:hypothetical protein
MATLTIHTKPTQPAIAPTLIERFARRFLMARKTAAFREIGRRSFDQG